METRYTSQLRPHPENVKIYNDHADPDLVASVQAKGIINPLLITYDNRIINGHRRHDAALKAGLFQVPVVVFGSHDELDILEALIESNRQRLKTNEQIGREASALLEIESRRAGQRRISTQNNYTGEAVKELVPDQPVSAGQARDIVGAKLGYSGRHVEQAATVVKTIDTLQQSGNKREAEQLRTALNQNVKKAYSAAQERGYIAPPSRVQAEPKSAGFITLDQWNQMGEGERELILTPELTNSKFNDQKNDNIEWAMWSWNPVTGCKHDCPYCYARDIAERFYEQKFQPAFIPDRLCAPGNMRLPFDAQTNIGYKNVFTCSMADLFGRWVPTEWIEAVLTAVRKAPEWNFLFLTKFPIRMSEFEFPDNAWVGTTVDCQARVNAAESAFQKIDAKVKWLSCEPLLEPLEFTDLSMFQWIVLGGSSKSTQTPEWRPPRSWINRIEDKAHEAGCMVYEKTNLLERTREYPGQAPASEITLPNELRYLPSIG